jgi:hypothetical protein
VQEHRVAAGHDGTCLGRRLRQRTWPGVIHHVEQRSRRLAGNQQPLRAGVSGTCGDGRDEQVASRGTNLEQACPGTKADLEAEALGGGPQPGGARGVANHDVGAGRAKFADGGQGRAGCGARADDRDGSGGRHPRLCERVHDALDVGVVAVAALGTEHDRVRAAGGLRQVVGMVEQRQHRALERHRQRQPGPLGAARAHVASQGRLVALDQVIAPAGQAERVVGRPVQRGRQRVRYGLAENGGLHQQVPGRLWQLLENSVGLPVATVRK